MVQVRERPRSQGWKAPGPESASVLVYLPASMTVSLSLVVTALKNFRSGREERVLDLVHEAWV
jgi:hypothetical protein